MKVAITTFATGHYKVRQQALLQTAKQYAPHIPLFAYYDFNEIGSPDHAINPYAFKVYCMEAVRNKGFDIVIWLDAPVFLLRPIDEWVEEIKKVGVYLQEGGFKVGQWANDRSLAHFNLTRDEAITLPNIHAQILAFDFSNPKAQAFFEEWKHCCAIGLFKGQWNNHNKTESQDPRCLGHRHDQTCLELLANKRNIPLQKPVLSKYFGAK